MDQARLHASIDIAHRWFAFFEGQTESVAQHLAIFTPDVRLVHAGRQLLAEGSAAMARWLGSVPWEEDAHVITEPRFRQTGPDSAELDMTVHYQVLGNDGRLGGAVIAYHTQLRFDRQDRAAFHFIQKTPVAPNPAQYFAPSFAANRLASLTAHLRYLEARGELAALGALMGDKAQAQQWHRWLAESAPAPLSALNAAPNGLELAITLGTRQARFILRERQGRYLTIEAFDPGR